MDVGYESGSLVTDDYPAPNAFSGKLDWVDLSIGPAEADHLIDPQELMKIAMVRQ
jgi:arylsulfatase